MTDGWPDDQLSCNDFLGGRLKIWQPRQGYRAGIDPVLLAACVPARTDQSVLDLGCGAGVAGLCLAARVPGVVLSGLELQPAYAELARRNAAQNGVDFTVITGDLASMPEELRQSRFDHVIANPPYFRRDTSSAARDPGRETAMGEQTPLAVWVSAASRRLLPGGSMTFILRTDRLPELMQVAGGSLGSLRVLPLIPRPGRAARLMLFRAIKGGRAAFQLLDGWQLHQGDHHDQDCDDYTKNTGSILRDAAPLPF